MMPSFRRPKAIAATVQAAHLPAPIGFTTMGSGAAMPPEKCVQLFNLVGAEYGLRARLGSREWCTGLAGTSDTLVRSVVPFAGAAENGANDRLFATTSAGIYDVTTSSTSPTLVYAFVTPSGDAGYGVAHVMVTASAGHFLIYCDEENGMHVYSEASDTWTAPAMGAGAGEIDNVDPADLVFCTVFKGRPWFVERGTASLWYLDAGALYGAATKFGLGTRLRAGGPLVGVWNWTYDGGAGLDDSLVAVSGGGDVVIYGGTDPSSSSTFGLKGVWYAGGGLPRGRNIATNYGGDMLLMSRVGIIPLSKLVIGGTIDVRQYQTADIASLFNRLMLSKSTLRGWSIRMHPEENALMVTVPVSEDAATTQLAMSLATQGWSEYRGLPIFSSEVFGGKLYFGTTDGRVCINDGYVDGVTLADPDSYANVEYALLSSFQNLGTPRKKRVQMIKPIILSESSGQTYGTSAKYDFDFGELAPPSPATATGTLWDSATWDASVWSAEYVPTLDVRGSTGLGSHVAIAMRGSAASRTIIVGFDVFFDMGGLL